MGQVHQTGDVGEGTFYLFPKAKKAGKNAYNPNQPFVNGKFK